MLKINFYNESSFDFFKAVLNSKKNTKNNPNFKNEVEAISNTQSTLFSNYDMAFENNNILTINPADYRDFDHKNLQALYSYRSKKIQELKELLTKHPIYKDRVLNTCQNCTINEVDSMDHILGQTKFPEYSVHPKNLFPCCSVCNKKKSDKLSDINGSQLFLNLYLDDLPKSQYLHVDFGTNWLPRFWLERPKDVSVRTFDLIHSHYSELNLLNRFRDSSYQIIDTLKSTIKVYGSTHVVQEKTEELCSDLGPILGYNHRQIVLYRALGRSKEFVHECLN